MRSRPLSFLLLLLPAFLTACSTLRMREEVAVPPEKGRTIYGTQVALGKCALRKEGAEFAAAPIVGALVASAISEGVNRIGIALNEAAQKKEVSVSAARNIEISKNNFSGDPPCLQLVRGWFYIDPSREGKEEEDLDSDPKIIASRNWIDQDLKLKSIKTLWRNGIWLAARPDFLFEGVLASSMNGKAQTVIPHYTHFNEPLFTRLFRPGRTRHIAVFFAFHKPSEAAEMPTHPAATFIIGKLAPGEVRRYPYQQKILDGLEQKVTTGNGAAQENRPILNRWPHESEWFSSLDLGDTPQPLKVSALITETEEASEFLGFVAAIFAGGGKEAVTKELQTSFVPEKRAAAEVEKARNETELEEKIDAAVGALKACKDSASLQNATAARKALREINAGAVAARIAPVVDQSCIDQIKQTDATKTIATACDNVLDAITLERSCPKKEKK